MKKIISLFLCLAVLLAGAALAENAGKESLGTLNVNKAFDIRCRLPEGYQVVPGDSDDTHIFAEVRSDDAAKPVIQVSVVFNELYTLEDGTAQKLNDVSEEVMTEIRDSFAESGVTDAVFEEAETAFGTKLLIVRGHYDGRDAVFFYSIYKSHEIELAVYPGEGADGSLTEEQVGMILDFLSEMDFVEV